MSLEDWLKNGWLKNHKTSREEIRQLFRVIERDLVDCSNSQLSEDWCFAIAYNAARQCCLVALYCSGYRTGRGGSEHYYVIQSLAQTLGTDFREIRDYLDTCRNKRNISDYDSAGMISKHEVDELIDTTRKLYENVRRWVSLNHPNYFPD